MPTNRAGDRGPASLLHPMPSGAKPPGEPSTNARPVLASKEKNHMKHIKILGLVAFSAMALVALLGTASASASSFTAGEVGKTITTTNTNHVFTITGSEVVCSTIVMDGVTEGTLENGKYHSTTQRVHPTYSGCKAFGFESGVSITTTGCDYVFSADTTPTTGKEEMANVEIVDHPGETCNGIVITADPPFTTCTAVVGKQTVSHAVSYKNVAGEKIEVKITGEAIGTNVTASSGLCPLTIGNHTGAAGGTYTGTSTVSASGGVAWTA
jgi:hypothetical protein